MARIVQRTAALLPTACVLCAAGGPDLLCMGCRDQFACGQIARCRSCGTLIGQRAGERCGACLKHPPAFDATCVACDYAPPLDQLVLNLKFGNRLPVAALMAGMLADTVAAGSVARPDVLTAVPLGRARLVERGFNQALEIAKPLARQLSLPLDRGLLARQRDTRAQSLLHPDERHANIRRAFIVPAAAMEAVRGRHIGVVDDVMTTGETLNEVAATLKRFGAARVTNFIFARTLPA
ncbi:ComF family protein [Oxalobacteraceae bacterium OM1]|nr:ComF family protein [Oxalobacteraceae bacterium OM1]